MSYAPIEHIHRETVAGQFIEIDGRQTFEYTTPLTIVPFEGYDRHVFVGPLQETRYARITASRAYVVVDEDAEGKPVVETWKIRSHRHYEGRA
jgi:hypothetical protein